MKSIRFGNLVYLCASFVLALALAPAAFAQDASTSSSNGSSTSVASGQKMKLKGVVTVLLLVAALGTSWSSYQATRWNGEQAKAASRTNAIRIDAARAQGLGQAQTQVDVATFIAWVDASQSGDPKLAHFYLDRFRDEFRPAFDACYLIHELGRAAFVDTGTNHSVPHLLAALNTAGLAP